MSEVQFQMMQAEGDPPQLSSSPSFSSYSSETFAQIAARVIDELRRDPHSLSDDYDDTLFQPWETDNFTDQPDDHFHHNPNENRNADADADTDDFEFAFVTRDPNSSPVSADDIFYNGEIRPIYPLFDRNLLLAHLNYATTPVTDAVNSVSSINNETAPAPVRRCRLPLGKLMFEDRETDSCSSSTSEAEENYNELEGVAEGTYCVWKPKSAAVESTGRPCKKSNSTGSSSKRWKLRELLLRSHSDGKEPLFFQGLSKRNNKVAHEVGPKPSSTDNNSAGAGATAKEGDQTKRKSFFPYRQELVRVGRNLRPF